ncbi:MAG: ABC transporter ATP-binding protein [Phycisphaerales bacterium]|nr:ABC transporter ATP-binding protein [Phycisphaerales bacterium]
MEHVISANGLTKYFGPHCAVDQVSFEVPRGSVTAFLGRNGSGKTTMLRILLGLLEPTRGSSTVFGHDSQHLPPELRGRIGYLAEGHPVIRWMTVAQSAKFQAACFPRWNQQIFDATVQHFSLSQDAKAGRLSRGQRAGLALALTLAAEPELLILDDPALGLDPVARRALLESILYITHTPGQTVLLSSHLLDDIERVADYVLILDKSVLRAACSLDEFRKRIAQYHLTFRGSPPLPPSLPTLPGLLDILVTPNTLRLTVANPPTDLEEQLAALQPVDIQQQPVNFQEAVTAYMSDHRSRTFFLEQLNQTAPTGGAA